jgi:hypothetical protein
MRKPLFSIVATFAVLVAATGPVLAQRLVTPLEEGLKPLVSDFDARSSNPRLLVILSPT